MIKTYLKTGARARELLLTKEADITSEGIYIHALKNSNDREIPLQKEDIYLLKQLPTVDGLIFPISYSRAVQLWHYYRPVQTKSLKCTRHTFAVELYKKTKDIRLVQYALGHRNINNTLVYAALVDGQEKLKAALL